MMTILPSVRDWDCASCAAHNFASRSTCFKCNGAKTGGEGFGTFGAEGNF